MIDQAALFYTLAQIAGVFVGFGALIAISKQKDEAAITAEKQALTGVVMIGLMGVIGALLPVLLAAYKMPLFWIWTVSAILMLLFDWATMWMQRQAAIDAVKRRSAWDVLFWIGLEGSVQVPLILLLLPILSDHAAALYTTMLIASIFQAAGLLMLLVLDVELDAE